MKLLLSLMTVAAASATAPLPIFGGKNLFANDISLDSAIGREIMKNSRSLADSTSDTTWISGFSLKFQGCHHISQWNANVDGNDDVRIETKRLIRFRLCPTSSCTAANAGGCKSGYGDYVLDMSTFLSSYVGSLEDYNDYLCAAVTCDCDSAEDQDSCLWSCYNAKGLDVICGIKNPNGNNKNNFKIEDYMGCGQYKGNRRELEAGEEEDVHRDLNNNNKYYLGPYCAEQGGAVYLGYFTDDTCTTFADEAGGATTFLTNTGTDMPYATTSIINMDCLDCAEMADYKEGEDASDEDTVKEVCENVYTTAGKCETSLSITTKNNVACNYMEGIKITRMDGTIVQSAAKANKTASVFIGLFVVAFLLLAAYVYYLKTKLDRASITLSE